MESRSEGERIEKSAFSVSVRGAVPTKSTTRGSLVGVEDEF